MDGRRIEHAERRAPTGANPNQESPMAKSQQRSSKEAKKPKKDDGTSKPLSPGAVSAPITTVVADRSKKKK
jgi:hypothetical protein